MPINFNEHKRGCTLSGGQVNATASCILYIVQVSRTVERQLSKLNIDSNGHMGCSDTAQRNRNFFNFFLQLQ